jgi:hypothetical protein
MVSEKGKTRVKSLIKGKELLGNRSIAEWGYLSIAKGTGWRRIARGARIQRYPAFAF